MANTIRIKRKGWSSGGSTDGPNSLAQGELAFNENNQALYIGTNINGSAQVTKIAQGQGLYVTIAGDETITGDKNFEGAILIDNTQLTATAAELNQLDNVTLGDVVTYNVGVGENNILQAAADIADDDFLRVNGSTIEGLNVDETKSALGLVVGTNVQAQDDLLQDIADITGTATGDNQFIVSTGVGTFALEDAETARGSLGLGTAATKTVGLSTGNVPTMSGTGTNASLAYYTGGGLGAISVNSFRQTSFSGGEGIDFTYTTGSIDLNLSELTTVTTVDGSVDFLPLSLSNGNNSKILLNNIGLSEFDNDLSLTTYALNASVASTNNGIATVSLDTNDSPSVSDAITITAGTNITITGSGDNIGIAAAEYGVQSNAGITIDSNNDFKLSLGSLSDIDSVTGSDLIAVADASDTGNTKKESFNSIPLSVFKTADDLSLGGKLTLSEEVDGDVLVIDHGDITLTEGDITLVAGALKGPSTFYIDPSPDDTAEPGGSTTDTGEVVILGDLRVTGTTTTVNSTEVTITDKTLTLADNQTTYAGLNGAGLVLGDPDASGGDTITFVYNDTSGVEAMQLSKSLVVTGEIQATDLDINGAGNISSNLILGGNLAIGSSASGEQRSILLNSSIIVNTTNDIQNIRDITISRDLTMNGDLDGAVIDGGTF